MTNIKRALTSGITKTGTAIPDVPDAPTIGSATATGSTTATVAYTAAVTGGTVTTFTATSTPGSITGTGSSPITVTGLTGGTAYTFKVKGTNATATGPESTASNSVTLLPTPPVATPSLWLDANLASSFTYSSSNIISSWADQSGNGRNATQATIANQPTLVSNVINSKPVVRFDATNDALAWTEYNPGGDRSIFMVFRNASNITSSGSFAIMSSSGANFPMYVVGLGNQTGGISGEVFAWLGVSSGGAQIRGRYNGTQLNAGNHQYNWTHDSSYALSVRLDKSTLSTQAAPAGDVGSTTYPGFIGVITGADGISLDIAEVLVYNRILTGGEITTIESYFTTKWAV